MVLKTEVSENKLKLPTGAPSTSDSVVIEGLCGEPGPGPVQKLADGSPEDAGAAQVSCWRIRKGGREEVWRCRRVIEGNGCKIHPPLVGGRPGRAGQRRVAGAGPLVLPQLALQNLNFVDQLGELVVGGDGASSGDARFGDPAQEEQLPQGQV